MGAEEIKKFFDQCSLIRDELFSKDPILGYEQEARQKAIMSLLDDDSSLALDAGCGNGRDFNLILNRAEKVIGLDFSTGMVKEAKAKADNMPDKRAGVLVGDVTRLPFKDNTFDLIVCSEVLEHIPNWKKVVSEFYYLLKPNGVLIISTPNKLSMFGMTRYLGRLILGSKHPYDKWKTYFEHKHTLKDAGFKVVAVRGACYFPGDLSYHYPIKNLILKCLKIFRKLDEFFRARRPFCLLGYTVVIKSKKKKD